MIRALSARSLIALSACTHRGSGRFGRDAHRDRRPETEAQADERAAAKEVAGTFDRAADASLAAVG